MVTECGRTKTVEGYIAHRTYRGVFHPVKIELDVTGYPIQDRNGLPKPLRKFNQLVYACPGGSESSR